MRIVVVGATGNVGTSVLGALSDEDTVESVVGVARRRPSIELPKVRWETADISGSELTRVFEGADVVIHLAWALEPSHRPLRLERINVTGGKRVFDAAGRAGVKALIVSSSVGAYSPKPNDDHPVTETWSTSGIEGSDYSAQKAAIETALDELESTTSMRIVRLRPSLLFKGDAASEIKRLFLGPLVPTQLLRFGRIPLMPLPDPFRIQVTHTSDVAEAFRQAAVRDVRGAFNIAAEPVLDRYELAEMFRAKLVTIPSKAMRTAFDVAWRARLQRTDAGWIDMALQAPLLDSTRARNELGWTPSISSRDALAELVDGLAWSRDWATPTLSKRARAEA